MNIGPGSVTNQSPIWDNVAKLWKRDRLAPAVYQPIYAATLTLDCSLYNVLEVTLTGNVTISFSNGRHLEVVRLVLKQDATGGRILSWGAGVSLGTDITDTTLSNTANAIDVLGVMYNASASKYFVVSLARGYA